MTAQGHPRAIFKPAIKRGNVQVAEATSREIGLSLEEALQLGLLYAAYEPDKLERAALRWFARYLKFEDRIECNSRKEKPRFPGLFVERATGLEPRPSAWEVPKGVRRRSPPLLIPPS